MALEDNCPIGDWQKAFMQAALWAGEKQMKLHKLFVGAAGATTTAAAAGGGGGTWAVAGTTIKRLVKNANQVIRCMAKTSLTR
jgi:hypothetical protein